MLTSGPVRPLFRVVGWVLGPLLLAAGALLILLGLRGVDAHGWPAWAHRVRLPVWLGLGNVVIGWLLLGAARTGVDPYAADLDPDRPSPRGSEGDAS